MKVIIEYGGSSLGLVLGETVVGRGVNCHIRFNDPAVSRRHARFIVQEERALLEDLGTMNGTLLNDERISGTRILAHGDRVSIGWRVLSIKIFDDAPDDDSWEDTTADRGDLIAQIAQGTRAGELLVIRDFQLGEIPPTVPHHNCPGCRAALAPDSLSCPKCGTLLPRVRTGTKTLEISREALERRRQPRRRVNVPCLYNSDNLTFEAVACDVSENGLFIASELVDDLGTPCAVTLLADGKPPCTVVGVVSRIADDDGDHGRGMGIRLSSLSGKQP